MGFRVVGVFFSQILMIKLMRSFCSILEKKDDFDWGKYLMEGEEVGLGPDMDTPVSGGSAHTNVSACPRGSSSPGVSFCHKAYCLT